MALWNVAAWFCDQFCNKQQETSDKFIEDPFPTPALSGSGSRVIGGKTNCCNWCCDNVCGSISQAPREPPLGWVRSMRLANITQSLIASTCITDQDTTRKPFEGTVITMRNARLFSRHLTRHLSLIAGLLLPVGLYAGDAKAPTMPDPYKDGGNVPLSAVKLTAEQEAELLKDVKADDAFDVTLFAPSQMINYPVFVAASVDGMVFVGSDGNGAQGTAKHRGRIVRLRDTDGDGRADETKMFVKDVDSPRGVVWDHDRLYVIHPPNLSVYIDKNGDGEADESKVLVEGIGWSFKDRAADHATNGLNLGVDGYLYVTAGDFGIMKATGTDGRVIQHRAGGVIRVRTDGTGLEIFSTGTRNILEVATSPLLDHFTRDNTNDGGGWNVRFHYFTGLENHGYPRLYRYFSDEHIKPLADYGGGSGCGAVWVDEPAFRAWSGPSSEPYAGAPFTVDWGTGAVSRHAVKRVSSSYEETEKPKQIVKVTKPTDADVDGLGNMYVASWKGAVFNWVGGDVGYLIRLRPKGFVTPPLMMADKADAAALVKELSSDSHRRRLAAQRELIRRAQSGTELPAGVTALTNDLQQPLAVRVVALGAIYQTPTPPTMQAKRGANDPLVEYDLRFSAMRGATINPSSIDPTDPRVVLQGVIAAAQSKQLPAILPIADKLANHDDRIAHTIARALGLHGEVSYCFKLIDDTGTSAALRTAALRGVAMHHTKEAVDGLIQRVNTEQDPARRRGLLSASCRLHFIEGKWKGDSWGTRPDTRGPYYQPDPWELTDVVFAALKQVLDKAPGEEVGFLVAEMNRNRIKSNDALKRILALAQTDASQIPTVTGQLATADDVPAEAVPLLIKAATMEGAASNTYMQAVIALAKVNSADGLFASFIALEKTAMISGSERDVVLAKAALVASPHLEHHIAILAKIARGSEQSEATKAELTKLANDKDRIAQNRLAARSEVMAEGMLLKLAVDQDRSVETRSAANKAIDDLWTEPKLRIRILTTIGKDKLSGHAERVTLALNDTDKGVVKAAKEASNRLGLDKQVADKTPKINTLKREEILALIVKTSGDKDLGEQLFDRQTCIACHTTNESQPLKGPYLGNITQTYKRVELAENILDPNKTVAQGFITNLISVKDGTQQMGFITLESSEKVVVRNLVGQEIAIKPSDITSRIQLPQSMMPPGLVDQLTVFEFASMLDYLDGLAKK